MSEILSNIVVEQTSINFSPETNNINVTPEAIQLNVFTGAAPGTGQSTNGQLLYNNTNLIDGVPNTSFSSGNLSLGNIANVKISGGSNNYSLLTDGTGNLSFAIPPNAGNVVNSAQPNITSVGTLTALNVNGTSNLGNVGNVKITGGTNGFVLQTDGTGNLDWTAMTGGGGNGAPGGSNTQIQYNDGGLFGGASGFTFNEVSGNVAIPGALAVTGTISGTLSTAAQPNITSVGTLTDLSANGNITAVNITANTGVFTGNGSALTALNGSNITTGTIAAARVATLNQNTTGSAATVTTAAQPNITSVGTLTSLSVTGNSNVTNLNISNTFGLGSGTERVTISNTAANTSLNFNVINNAILYQSANAVSNISLNIRGNATVPLSSVVDVGNSVTITFINRNSSPNAYGVQTISIDGNTVTPMWSGTTGNGFPATVNGRDMYTFNIIRTDSTTYAVMGTRIGFI